ncbi:MAG: hypothetical protein K2J30_05900 [Clostridia bacterium]|nr:hypothetical protein [Clostridia bacterium]
MNIYQTFRDFYSEYRGEKRIIGRSAEGRLLFAFFAGEHGGKTGIFQYAMHAREWVTSLLALEHIARGVKYGGVWFIPLVNPDGALLCTNGIESVKDAERRKKLLRVNGGEDFSLWKANADCVDLNVNFPAQWGKGASNVRALAPHGYIGECPLCAPESRALADFTREIKADYTVSWHTKGEEIYWRFGQDGARLKRDFEYAEALSKSVGYPLAEAPNSTGGYKDWCVETLKIPAFTVEAGSDKWKHPLGEEALPELINNCGNAALDLTEFVWKRGS